MGSNYPRKEQLLKLAPTFVGQTLAEAATKVSLASAEYLFGRLHRYNISFEVDGPTFDGKITSVVLPPVPNNPNPIDNKNIEFDDTGFGYIFPQSFPEKKEIKTQANVIRLPNDEYDQLVKNFRRKHIHR